MNYDPISSSSRLIIQNLGIGPFYSIQELERKL